jgi:hypothetical protein
MKREREALEVLNDEEMICVATRFIAACMFLAGVSGALSIWITR